MDGPVGDLPLIAAIVAILWLQDDIDAGRLSVCRSSPLSIRRWFPTRALRRAGLP
jgi:hypothetical protein